MFYHTWGKMLLCRKKTSFGLDSQPCVICWICLSLSSGSLFMLILFTLISVSSPTSYPCFLPLFPPALPQQFSIQRTHSYNLWLSTSRNKICFLFTECDTVCAKVKYHFSKVTEAVIIITHHNSTDDTF